MDGYAVRLADVAAAAADAPVVLDVIADLPAGSAEHVAVGHGQAARIMTGAPIPEGADAVVPVERTDGGTARVAILAAPRPAHHIRRRGEDLHAGDRALGAGVVLDARRGRRRGRTRPYRRGRPRRRGRDRQRARRAGRAARPGRIHDSNSLLLAASSPRPAA